MKKIVESYRAYHLIKENNDELLAKEKVKLTELESKENQLKKEISSHEIDLEETIEKMKEIDSEIKEIEEEINKVKSKSSQAWNEVTNAHRKAKSEGRNLTHGEMSSILFDYGIKGAEKSAFYSAKGRMNGLIKKQDKWSELNAHKYELEQSIGTAKLNLSKTQNSIKTTKTNIQKYSQTQMF